MAENNFTLMFNFPKGDTEKLVDGEKQENVIRNKKTYAMPAWTS